MTKEDKDLLLKDLSGRLTYGVHFISYRVVYGAIDITYLDNEKMMGIIEDTLISQSGSFSVDKVKPYLRPMSSMTEEEYKELKEISEYYGFVPFKYIDDWCPNYDMTDWLNAHHFDYRGLIEKGLAIEVTEDNNPYKE